MGITRIVILLPYNCSVTVIYAVNDLDSYGNLYVKVGLNFPVLVGLDFPVSGHYSKPTMLGPQIKTKTVK